MLRSITAFGVVAIPALMHAQVVLNTMGTGKYGTQVEAGRIEDKNVEWAVALKVRDTVHRSLLINDDEFVGYPGDGAFRAAISSSFE